MKTAYLTHPIFLEHQTGSGHPERPGRLVAIEARLRDDGLWDELEHMEVTPATNDELEFCHTREHIQRVKAMAESGGGALDGDTKVSALSYQAACMASGAAMRAVDAIMSGTVDNAFAAVRPPGHHAESGKRPDSLWGFCLFNHVAMAARYAQRQWGLERVAILDFDVHHGNGTQEIFYEDGSVFFASIHESPLFPYQGEVEERGVGEGHGKTLNIPLPAGCDGEIYKQAWTVVGKAMAEFKPQLIILSAGFDAHINDPLAHMRLQTQDYSWLVSEAKNWARTYADGRILAVLEGGYHLENLSGGVAATLEVLKAD